MKAIIKTSQREVDIALEDDGTFYVVHPPSGRTDSFFRAAGYQSVSGPFLSDDERFEFLAPHNRRRRS